MTQSIAFEPPGPGSWELDTTHWSRPVTRFTQEAVMNGFAKGFTTSAERYGLMLNHLEPAFVNGFNYLKAVGFGAPPDAKGPPPKIVLQLLTRVVPKFRRRIETAHQAMTRKFWRDDLARWDRDVKPAAIAKHLKLQSVDFSKLDDAALVSHIRDTHAHLGDMVRQHHEFTITATLPIGDFLAHLIPWTGKPAGELLQVLRGSSDVSLGVAKVELAALASAVNANAEAHAILNGSEPARAIVKALQAHPAIAIPLKAYLDLVEVRCFGYDLCAKSLGEMPELIVRTIQSAVRGEGATSDGARLTQDRISKLRSSVPAEHQASFDALLGEAVFINRLRDERGHYSDGWAVGIARRSLGEAGRRLAARGTFASAESAYDASLDEIIALLTGMPGPSDAELIARAAWRNEKTSSDPDIPVWLGAPPSPPPPSAWLPEKGRRADQAIGTFLGTMFIAHESHSTTQSVKGLSVSPGVYEGIARVVNHESEFGRIQQGDVLVTRSTSPYFNVVLPLLGAIVTDRGGQLCHAAIVAREYGIPAVVGTTDACKVIPDGARVRVDGAAGEVTVLA